MSATLFATLFAALLLLQLVLGFWLAWRQGRHVAAHWREVPPEFEAHIPVTAHRRAAEYTQAKLRFGLVTAAWGAAVLIAWTLLGGLDFLNGVVKETLWPRGALVYQLGLLVAFSVIQGLIDTPLEAWRTFRIEQAFGFNRSTPALFIVDALKGALVGALLGVPLAAAVLALMDRGGTLWWLWAWALWATFSVLMMIIVPTWIAPLFNKFKPLPEDERRARIVALIERCGFTAKGLFVMDGSRRSAHANAYFTGLGASKRVVFFDTLLDKLKLPELEAVLAHELGHFRHHHVTQRLALMLGLGLAGFALLGWLLRQLWFFEGLGVRPNMDAPNSALALILVMLVLPVFTFLARPLLAALSRRQEYQADAYACTKTHARDLASALIKLYEDNASTLTPDPWYVRFYYTHPPALQRLAAMRALDARRHLAAAAM